MAPPTPSPRYPHLPSVPNVLYGPRPNQPPVPFRPASPPIRPGSLASQPDVTASPVVPDPTQSVSSDPTAPVVPASQAMVAAGAVIVPAQPIPVQPAPDFPAVTGTRPRTPSGQNVPVPPPVPVLTSPATRSSSGISKPKQFSQDFVNHGKNLLGVKKKKESKRSISEDPQQKRD